MWKERKRRRLCLACPVPRRGKGVPRLLPTLPQFWEQPVPRDLPRSPGEPVSPRSVSPRWPESPLADTVPGCLELGSGEGAGSPIPVGPLSTQTGCCWQPHFPLDGESRSPGQRERSDVQSRGMRDGKRVQVVFNLLLLRTFTPFLLLNVPHAPPPLSSPEPVCAPPHPRREESLLIQGQTPQAGLRQDSRPGQGINHKGLPSRNPLLSLEPV